MFSSDNIKSQSYASPALVFYKIQPNNEPCINRVAAWATGSHGMAHVELRFSNGESVSVFQNETVFLKKRGYSNKQYVLVPLTNVSAEQESRMYAFAQKQSGKAFNQSGLKLAWAPSCFRRTTDGENSQGSWFCSELVTSTLQQAGHLLHVEPNGSSPNQLYDTVRAGKYSSLGGAVGVNTLAMSARQTSLEIPGITRQVTQSNGQTRLMQITRS